jgi:serine/threonine protein kinase
MGGIELGIDGLADAELIGRGGFAKVYASTDTRFGRRVAVKVLGSSLGEAERRRFDRECAILGRLSGHPNVITVYSGGYTDDGSAYLVMELVEGGTLADQLSRRGPLPWREAVDLVIPTGRALAEAHRHGILHRDVKPENILLAGDQPRLTDFGIAYLRDATGATSTQITASWLHTPPETFSNERDERSDLYSLASTLYCLVRGHPPFWHPDDESLNPLMYRLLHDPPPPIEPPVAPAPLNELLARSLAKDPEQRPSTVAEFVALLEGISADPHGRPPAEHPTAPPIAQSGPDVSTTEPLQEATLASTAAGGSTPTSTDEGEQRENGQEREDGENEASPAQIRRRETAPAGAVGPGDRTQWPWVAGLVAVLVLVAVVAAWLATSGNGEEPDSGSGTAARGAGDDDVVYDRHEDTVTALIQLDDGRIASASDDMTVRVWSLDDPSVDEAVFSGHGHWVRSVVQLHDGAIASASEDGTVLIWRPEEPENLLGDFDGHGAPVATVAVLPDPDGRMVSGGEDAAVWVWDPYNPADAVVYDRHDTVVRAVAVLSDGRIASGALDGEVHLWHPADPGAEPLVLDHPSAVLAVAQPFDDHLLVAGEDGTVRLWDLNDQGQPTDYVHPAGVSALTPLGDDRFAAGLMDGTVWVWELDNGDEPQFEYAGHAEHVRALLELDDGRLASGSVDGTVRVWSSDVA